jgi:hypothetical protein
MPLLPLVSYWSWTSGGAAPPPPPPPVLVPPAGAGRPFIGIGDLGERIRLDDLDEDELIALLVAMAYS